MWSGQLGKVTGIFEPNHVVPLLKDNKRASDQCVPSRPPKPANIGSVFTNLSHLRCQCRESEAKGNLNSEPIENMFNCETSSFYIVKFQSMTSYDVNRMYHVTVTLSKDN